MKIDQALEMLQAIENDYDGVRMYADFPDGGPYKLDVSSPGHIWCFALALDDEASDVAEMLRDLLDRAGVRRKTEAS